MTTVTLGVAGSDETTLAVGAAGSSIGLLPKPFAALPVPLSAVSPCAFHHAFLSIDHASEHVIGEGFADCSLHEDSAFVCLHSQRCLLRTAEIKRTLHDRTWFFAVVRQIHQ